MDIRDPWPFQKDSVEVIYSRHCFEHFNEVELLSILGRCHHVLMPKHGLRIAVPSLEAALKAYANEGFPEWVQDRAKSAGRRFFLYITDNGNHGIILDFTYLADLLELAGFTDITQQAGGRTTLFDCSLLPASDHPEDVSTLYVEARKG
jgi:predicted SAM-dependent methyltransferase